jgi:hypothetical protein
MPYALPADVDERPVVIDGAGTLGRRIASVYAAGGSLPVLCGHAVQERWLRSGGHVAYGLHAS